MRELNWVEAEGGYAVALRGGQIVARGPRGNTLKSVPASIRDGAMVNQLRELREWLKTHERECLQTVDTWMVRSLPIPTKVLQSIWIDPAWRTPLMDAVAVTQSNEKGFLRHVDTRRGVGLVTLDGESVFSLTSEVTLPHPVNLPELDDFRDFATELQVEQGVAQLYREVWRKPAQTQHDKQVSDFSNGKFGQLMFATSRCRSLGYQFSGGYAVTRKWENGASLEARYWIGSDAPEAEVWTGDLTWVDGKSEQVELEQVGPVAYSEGMRMAAAIYAGRQAET